VARRIVTIVVAIAVTSATGATAAVTGHNASGTVVLNGTKAFPIVLAKGPPPNGTTPAGGDAFAEVVGAGVNVFKVGPATVPWTDADIAEAKVEDQAAAAHGAYTWINLSTVSRAAAGTTVDALLQKVVTLLKDDPAVAMWKGADEPWWSHFQPADLQFAYCRSTGRGQPGWCGGEPILDAGHEWVTIQAPRGATTDLAPFSAVTDVHGVDIYPVTITNPNADLHSVGVWTSTVASVTPNHAVWTTLQICASGSVDANGNFVLPTRAQERYMVYDAIINGARSLAFYGGNNPDCWNADDTAHQWSWAFWNGVLRGLVGEISAISPIAPALVNADTAQTLSASDPTTEVIARGGNANDLWVFAARAGAGTQPVTISGLPATATAGDVYTEGRSVPVANGSLTDTFDQWGVHVYHVVVPPTPPPPAAPSLASFAPSSGPPGTRVTLTGSNLSGTTAVTFGGAAAGFTVVSATEVAATVPGGAATGPITVTTPGGTATTATAFTVTAPEPPAPPPSTGGSSGGQPGPTPPNLGLTLAAKTPSVSVGGTDDLVVTAVDAGGGSTRVALTIVLPGGLALVGPPAFERGSGCAGTTTIVCDLDFLEPSRPTRILFSVRATAAGDQRLDANIASAQPDAAPGDNAAALTITVAPPVAFVAPKQPAVARATQGADRIVGTARADTIRGLGGSDTLLGLGGNDILDGGPGNDTLVGGAGRDTLYGRTGNDVLSVRDGRRDRVSCGPGRDHVIADRLDSVAADCERVIRR
jgi:Ca2+-binding RTX toxin-like protein